jgi:hypothetical protein
MFGSPFTKWVGISNPGRLSGQGARGRGLHPDTNRPGGASSWIGAPSRASQLLAQRGG